MEENKLCLNIGLQPLYKYSDFIGCKITRVRLGSKENGVLPSGFHDIAVSGVCWVCLAGVFLA